MAKVEVVSSHRVGLIPMSFLAPLVRCPAETGAARC